MESDIEEEGSAAQGEDAQKKLAVPRYATQKQKPHGLKPLVAPAPPPGTKEDRRRPSCVFADPARFGVASQRNDGEWDALFTRAPVRVTHQELARLDRYLRIRSVMARDYCEWEGASVIRCLVGGRGIDQQRGNGIIFPVLGRN